MNKITVMCHKDHDKGYEDYIGKCLLCEIEQLQKREFTGLTESEMVKCIQIDKDGFIKPYAFYKAIESKLKEKNG